MEKLTSLTKENFWNYLMNKDPQQIKIFCLWIDKYKISVNWDRLFRQPIGSRPVAHPDPFFNIGLDQRQKDWDRGKIKYHDLPIAMQLGIFIQFCFEQGINTSVFLGETGVLIDSMDEIPKAISMCLHDWMPQQQEIIEENGIDDETEGMAFI